ncbi:unnamed protein product [Cyprideis torosa]|uniref:Protein Wnt n=1 Tax=Cyprideis torosa TaxID=163714 RepID=A0A7R8WBT0_9CRUS|nr:unnamed protein product [Cyprideis torosa]CAG0891222.1 unnamed protein product [Cyprideis torosa]
MRWRVGAILTTTICVLNFIAHWSLFVHAKEKRQGSKWWGVALFSTAVNFSLNEPDKSLNPRLADILRRKQVDLVVESPSRLFAVVDGIENAMRECKLQHKDRPWDCPTYPNSTSGRYLFGKIVNLGCRETAFIYALTSASVMWSAARGCAMGAIDDCDCYPEKSLEADFPYFTAGQTDFSISRGVQRRSNEEMPWSWGGCSANVRYGEKFSRRFVDADERGKDIRTNMNLHNNRVGREVVREMMVRECKCHGVSGSCAVKTCWLRTPSFRNVAQRLKEKFDGSVRIRPDNSIGGRDRQKRRSSRSSRGLRYQRLRRRMSRTRKRRSKYDFQLLPYNREHKKPSYKDLVYFESSPSFCRRNRKLTIPGTSGRRCDPHSPGVGGCDLLCCGRGYVQEIIEVANKCNCTFKWCCEEKEALLVGGIMGKLVEMMAHQAMIYAASHYGPTEIEATVLVEEPLEESGLTENISQTTTPRFPRTAFPIFNRDNRKFR